MKKQAAIIVKTLAATAVQKDHPRCVSMYSPDVACTPYSLYEKPPNVATAAACATTTPINQSIVIIIIVIVIVIIIIISYNAVLLHESFVGTDNPNLESFQTIFNISCF